MAKGDYLTSILRSPKTVFTLKDIALLWQEPISDAARVRLNYYVRQGDLYRIRNGLYAKSENYAKLELATRILTPAYVSFETILASEGLIFQYYEAIFVASYTTRNITIGGQTYTFRKIKAELLVNSAGIEHVQETSLASRERAFLDMLYGCGDYHFDNLRSLDWDIVIQLLPIYDNQRMSLTVKRMFQENRPGT
jgi:predicted transcriptional regulator of viral defense system